MPENFNFLYDNKYEIGSVRNFLLSASVNANRKNRKASFHVIYSIVCALVLYLGLDASILGPEISGLCLLIFPAMCTYPLLYSGIAAKCTALFVAPAAFAVRTLSIGNSVDFYSVAASTFTYLLCVLCAVVFARSVIAGYTKNTTFVLITCCYGLVFVIKAITFVISVQGAFSLSLATKTVNDILSVYSAKVVEFASTDEGFALYAPLFKGTSAEITKEFVANEVTKILSDVPELIKSFVPFIPSFLAVICMFYSFITVAIFSFFARKLDYDVFTCIMDKRWTYRPSMLSIKIYDVVFFAFIICMFVNVPENISAAIINLFIILTPLTFVSGIRCIYTFFAKKTARKLLPAVIMAIVITISFMTIGALTAFIVSSIGISFMIARDKEERTLLPIKLMEDADTYKKLFSKEEQSK